MDDANYSYAFATVHTQQCGDERVAILHDVVVPMLLPDISISTSPTRFAPINLEQMVRFNGTSWERFGDVRTASSSHVPPLAAFGPEPRT